MHAQILELLKEKNKLFSSFEQITGEMAFLGVDELIEAVEKRDALLLEVEAIDAQIEKLSSEQQGIRQVLRHEADRDRLSVLDAALYDAALSVKATVNRILKNSHLVSLHMESEKARILEKMQEHNRSGESVATQYHQSVLTGMNPAPKNLTDKFI